MTTVNRPTTLTRFAWGVLVALALCGPLIAAPAAQASSGREFVRQIKGPFVTPRGIATDTAGNLWVADPEEGSGSDSLFEFNASGTFLGPLPGPAPLSLHEAPTHADSLAIEAATGHFYVTGESRDGGFPPFVEAFDAAGNHVAAWKMNVEFAGAHVGVDNSTSPFDPSAGSIYVTHPRSNGSTFGVDRFNASGEPVPFSGSAEYITGNEITGTPGQPFSGSTHPTPGSIAVDKEGNIYTVDAGFKRPGQTLEEGAVVEFSPEGSFMRACTGEENPGLGEDHHGWGGGPNALKGVAVAPDTGDILVAVSEAREEKVVGAIDEFDPTCHFIGQVTETSSGSQLGLVKEMAVDSSGNLYVVDTSGNVVDVFSVRHTVPSLSLAKPFAVGRETAVLAGTVNPKGAKLSDCHFEYLTDEAFRKEGFAKPNIGPCEPAASAIQATSEAQPVRANLSGLASGTTYRYRLLATTEGTLGGTAATEPLAFTAQHAPSIDSSSASGISSTSAELEAQINPLGASTSYHFEYDTSPYTNAEAHGNSVPIPDAVIGSGEPTGSVDARIARHIGALTPGTTYHFRVVAQSTIEGRLEASDGPDVTFVALPAGAHGLPDGRAYELVTPANKGSAEDMFATPEENNPRDTSYASASGDQLLLETAAAFGPFPASGENVYVFARTAEGWRATSLASPTLGVQTISADTVLLDHTDMSRVGFNDGIGSGTGVDGVRQTSLVGPPGGGPAGGLYAMLHTDRGERIGAQTEETQIAGASNDLSHLVLETKDHTTCPGAEAQDPGSFALCEFAGGEPRLLNVGNDGSLLTPCGAILGVSAHRAEGQTHDAVSADGSRVFFTAPDPHMAVTSPGPGGPGCWDGATSNTPQLYLRAADETVQVSAPEPGVTDPTGRHPAVFVGASEDGSKVFFVTTSELTRDDLGIHDVELYEYDIANARLTRISAGESGNSTAGVRAVLAVSADGSAVYFTATGILTANAPATTGEPYGEPQVNLYRYDTRASGPQALTYVATIGANSDFPGVVTENNGWVADALGEHVSSVALVPTDWYTTPDGRFFLFASTHSLTGYDTTAVNPVKCKTTTHGGAENGHCSELYRYDSANGSLICVSCDPSGARPVSNALFADSTPRDGAAGANRALSDDGSYAFFDTADPLVPQDDNGVRDVYEWHEGRVSLISSGHDPFPSYYLSSSPDGANVFFGTHARLVPQDTDTAGDVYDARICTPSDPCLKPPPGDTAQCEGDACQIAPPLPPAQVPATLTTASSGNLAAPAPVRPITKKKLIKCKKGRRLSHGKCVKKKPKARNSKARRTGHGRRTKS